MCCLISRHCDENPLTANVHVLIMQTIQILECPKETAFMKARGVVTVLEELPTETTHTRETLLPSAYYTLFCRS